MVSKLKRAILHHFTKDFCHCPPMRYPYNSGQHSFGTENPCRRFYVIWRDQFGSGVFSNLSFVLCHLKVAEDLGMIPVVDFENFPTIYNRSTGNAWDQYFLPVSPFRLRDVYLSKDVYLCDGAWPAHMSYNITEIPGLHHTFHKYIRLQPHVQARIASCAFGNDRVLGVHFRGKKQNIAPGHSFGPTVRQMFKQTDEILEREGIDSIFLVTEELDYLDAFRRRYTKVIATDSFRCRKINAYNLSPREDHRYLLGLEILTDATLLSRCTGLLCSDSNVSEYAKFVNQGQYEFVCQIDNGMNSHNLYLARYLYQVKNLFPQFCGGLPTG